MLAAVPYTTFPTIELGPLTLRTFGLMVALGVLVGAWIAASYAERFGVDRDETYRVATWMVLAGIIGSRLTWVVTHTDQIDSPVDVIAIWEGGIQFSGGFICAILVGLPFFRRWPRLLRWRILDGYALGLSIGLALGRVGCYAVGEHFGRTTDFFLATRYDGGIVRESTLGDVPLVPGTTFHNTSLYELIYMVVLFALLGGLVARARRRGSEIVPGTLVGVFVLYYGLARFVSDSFRVNDERVLSMTGAQWMCLALVPAGIWILVKVRPGLAALAEEAGPASEEPPSESAESGEDAGEDAGEGPAETDAEEAEETAETEEAEETAETAERPEADGPAEADGASDTAASTDDPAADDSDADGAVADEADAPTTGTAADEADAPTAGPRP